MDHLFLFWIIVSTTGLVAVINFIFGIFVIVKTRRSIEGVFFSLVAFSSSFLCLTNVILRIARDASLANWTYAAGILVSTHGVVWALYFNKVKKRKILAIMAEVIGLIFFFLTFNKYFISSFNTPISFVFKIEPEIIFYFYLATQVIFLLIILILFIRGYKRSSGLHKLQIKYILYGIFCYGIIAITVGVILPSLGLSSLAFFDSLSSLFFIGFIVYTITRYRLMDIKVALKKGSTILLIAILALGVYSGIIILVNDSLNKYTSLHENWRVVILVILVAIGAPIIYQRIKIITERLWKKQRKIIAPRIPIIKQSVTRSKKEFREYIKSYSAKIKKGLNVDEVYFFLREKEEGFQLYYPSAQSVDFLLKDLWINYSDPLINYFEATKDVIILEEIPYLRRKDNTYLTAKDWKGVSQFMKKYGFSLAAPIFGPDFAIGIIFFGPKTKKAPFSLDEVKELKTSVEEVSSYVWSTLMYIWAVLRSEKIAQGKIDEVVTYVDSDK